MNFDAQVYSSSYELSVDDALIAINNNSLEKANSPIAPGFTEKIFWVILEFQSQLDSEYYLELANAHIDYYNVYQIKGGKPHLIFKGGDHFLFDTRAINYRYFVTPIKTAIGKSLFLLKIDKRNSSTIFPLKLWSKQGFYNHQNKENIYYGILLGLIIATVLVSFILSILFRSSLFGLYALYALLMGFYIFATLGFTYQFIYPHNLFVNDYIRIIITIINLFIGTIFFSKFLNFSRYCPRNLRIIKWILLSILIIFLAWIIAPGWTRIHGVFFLNLFLIHYMLITVIFIVSAFSIYKREKLNVIIFFTSNFLVLVSTFIFIAIRYGLIDPSIFSIEPMAVGFGLELLLLAVSMIARLKGMRIAIKIEQEKQSKAIDLKNHVFDINEVANIRYFKSIGHNLEFHIENLEEPIIIRDTIKSILLKYTKSDFIQTHRSYVVNINSIRIKYADKLMLHSGEEIPISRSFKSQLEKTLIKI